MNMQDFSLRQWLIIAVLVSVVVFGIGFICGRNTVNKSISPISNDSSVVISEDEHESTMMTVYVTGAVKNPDVYRITAGSIVKDAIEAAGGNLGNADLVSINLARKIQDSEEIIVPFKQENPGGNITITDSSIGKKININTASVDELVDLPGIGDVKAAAIIEYRKSFGYFADIQDIINVSGIGDKTFEKIKDLICVN